MKTETQTNLPIQNMDLGNGDMFFQGAAAYFLCIPCIAMLPEVANFLENELAIFSSVTLMLLCVCVWFIPAIILAILGYGSEEKCRQQYQAYLRTCDQSLLKKASASCELSNAARQEICDYLSSAFPGWSFS